MELRDPFDVYRSKFETRDRTHVQIGRSVPKMRAATLTFTWNFGKLPEQQSRQGTAAEGAAPSVIR